MNVSPNLHACDIALAHTATRARMPAYFPRQWTGFSFICLVQTHLGRLDLTLTSTYTRTHTQHASSTGDFLSHAQEKGEKGERRSAQGRKWRRLARRWDASLNFLRVSGGKLPQGFGREISSGFLERHCWKSKSNDIVKKMRDHTSIGTILPELNPLSSPGSLLRVFLSSHQPLGTGRLQWSLHLHRVESRRECCIQSQHSTQNTEEGR